MCYEVIAYRFRWDSPEFTGAEFHVPYVVPRGAVLVGYVDKVTASSVSAPVKEITHEVLQGFHKLRRDGGSFVIRRCGIWQNTASVYFTREVHLRHDGAVGPCLDIITETGQAKLDITESLHEIEGFVQSQIGHRRHSLGTSVPSLLYEIQGQIVCTGADGVHSMVERLHLLCPNARWESRGKWGARHDAAQGGGIRANQG